MFIISTLRRNLNLRTQRHAAGKILTAIRRGEYSDDPEPWVMEKINHSDWQIKNVAVKLIGICKFTHLTDSLLKLIGDDQEVGFIRRNAIDSLRKMSVSSPAIQKTIVSALDDTYWEVRTEAALWLSELAEPDSSISKLLTRRIYKKSLTEIDCYPVFWPKRIYREKNFEVRAAMILALGTVANTLKELHAIEIPLHEDLWKVRESALRAYLKAAIRLGVSTEAIASRLIHFDLTCSECLPNFPIRNTFNELSGQFKADESQTKDQSCSTN